jgi:lysophospholipase L1-like esterase
LKFIFYFLILLSLPAAGKNITIYGLGDSITSGTNADGFGNFLEFNWVTGFYLNDSHAQKFLKSGFKVTSYNFSVPGSVAEDLLNQVENINTEEANYVGISIGANDVCGWTLQNFENNSNKYIQNIDKFLNKLSAKYPLARVKFMPIPAIPHVKNLAGNSNYCQLVWSSSGVCKNILQENSSFILEEYSRLIFELNKKVVYFLNFKNTEL